MGNSPSQGFGVISLSSIKVINVGLSMVITHYFENDIKHGEIFYRCPGAVHYTAYAFARKHDGSNDIGYAQMIIGENVMYSEMKGCYGGGSGTWLVVEGGPERDDQGFIRPNPLIIRRTTRDEVFQNGTLTKYSHDIYHNMHPNQRCTNDCPHCRRD